MVYYNYIERKPTTSNIMNNTTAAKILSTTFWHAAAFAVLSAGTIATTPFGGEYKVSDWVQDFACTTEVVTKGSSFGCFYAK